MDLFSYLNLFLCLVSDQNLKSSLDAMERQIKRLENDIKQFSETDDEHDKFVEKMSISFFRLYMKKIIYSRSYTDHHFS